MNELRPFRRLKKGLLGIENAFLRNQESAAARAEAKKQAVSRRKAPSESERIKTIRQGLISEQKPAEAAKAGTVQRALAKTKTRGGVKRIEKGRQSLIPTPRMEIVTKPAKKTWALGIKTHRFQGKHLKKVPEREKTVPEKSQTTKWVNRMLARRESRKFVLQTYGRELNLPGLNRTLNKLVKIEENKRLNDFDKVIRSARVLEMALESKRNKMLWDEIETALKRADKLIDKHLG